MTDSWSTRPADADPDRSVLPPAREGMAEDDAWLSLPATRWTLRVEGDAALESHARGSRAEYELIEMIGGGAMGEVWSATQTSLDRPVAIKRLADREESLFERTVRQCEFRQEACIAGFLEHPNIVPVHDLGLDSDGGPLLCMKLVDGVSWSVMLAEDFATLPPEEHLAKHLPILESMAQGVAFAHARGIVHRDLKPAQVLVGAFGEVLLTDWGLALCYNPAALSAARDPEVERLAPVTLPTTTTAGGPAGTPSLMAPEQTRDDALGIGTWTDVYLLGGTLYHLLTGTYPHLSATSDESIGIARIGTIQHPSRRAPGRFMPPGLVRLCLSALESDPTRRPRDGADFLAALRDYMSGAENRARSRVLMEEAVAEFAATTPRTFSAIARSLRLVDEAVRLWPENAEANELRAQCLAEQAAAALREGDLLLARLAIARLPGGEGRAGLERRLNAATHQRGRARRERVLLKRASVSLLIALVIGGGVFGIRLSQERTSALRARDQAEAARERAEGLLGFMIGGLRERLEPIGRLDVLKGVGAKAEGYLSATGDTSGERGKELRTAVESLNRELDALASADQGKAPSSWMGIGAAAYLRVAAADLAALDHDAAVHDASLALAIYDKLAEEEPGAVDWQLGRANSLLMQAKATRTDLSAPHEAWIEPLDKAIALLEKQLDPTLPSEANVPDADARRLWLSLAELYTTRGATTPLPGEISFHATSLAQAHESCARAVAIADGLVAALPSIPANRLALGVALSHQAAALRADDEPKQARATLERAIETLEGIEESPRGSSEWSIELGFAHYQMGQLADREGSPTEALGHFAACAAIAMEPLLRDQSEFALSGLALSAFLQSTQIEAQIAAHEGETTSTLITVFEAIVADQANIAPAARWIPATFEMPRTDLIERYTQAGDAAFLQHMLDEVSYHYELRRRAGTTGREVWLLAHRLLAEGRRAQLQGDFVEAEEKFRSAEAEFQDMVDSWTGGRAARFLQIESTWRFRAEIALDEGDLSSALGDIGWCFSVLDDIGELEDDARERYAQPMASHRAMALLVRALIRERLGDAAASRADVDLAAELMQPWARDTRPNVYVQPLAAALAMQGRQAEAEKLLARIAERAVPSPFVQGIVAERGGARP